MTINIESLLSSVSLDIRNKIKIESYEKIDSTNNKLREILLKKELPSLIENYYVVIANYQTKGRGQFNRYWHSPKGNIYLSFSFYLKAFQSDFSLVIADKIVEVLKSLVQDPFKLNIKAPNDIYYENKKLSGILIENLLSKEGIKSVIGVGINCNKIEDFVQKKINKQTTSLSQICDKEINRSVLIGKILDKIYS